MTESAAITLHLADATGRHDIVPAPDHPQRAVFLRWLLFIVANIYPTYTYADDPARFVQDQAARESFKSAVDEHAKALYRQLDTAAQGPWFLGATFSALDIYIATLTHWRPGRAWFLTHTPKLGAIAQQTERLPALAAVWLRNFPDPPPAG
jgi:GST-like protein